MKKVLLISMLLIFVIALTSCDYHRPTPSSSWVPVPEEEKSIRFEPINPEESRDIAGYEVTFQLETPFKEANNFLWPEALKGVCIGSTYLQEGVFYYKEGVVEWREDCKTDYGGPGYRAVYLLEEDN